MDKLKVMSIWETMKVVFYTCMAVIFFLPFVVAAGLVWITEEVAALIWDLGSKVIGRSRQMSEMGILFILAIIWWVIEFDQDDN